ncbi:Hypothetical predicted protein [Pelobates cultripes]|uniref:Uncharacterized protein n=1 Tax=Pelobates cultripes TaxID=61616 RepID=A0AAD1RBU5_PELCU|nr:Hypothetical predicted protein [Pelobates cultripes]
MAAADHASGPTTTQPLQANIASEFPHEDQTAAAFDHFWARLWALTAQTPTAQPVERQLITSPAHTSAPTSNTAPLTGTNQESGMRTKPRPTGCGPRNSHRQPGSRRKRRTHTHGPWPLKIQRSPRDVGARPMTSNTTLDTSHTNCLKSCKAIIRAQKGSYPTIGGITLLSAHRSTRGVERPAYRWEHALAMRNSHRRPERGNRAPPALPAAVPE